MDIMLKYFPRSVVSKSPKLLLPFAGTFLTFVAFLPIADAQIQINSGGIVDVTSNTGPVAISNGTQLNVLNNGSVNGATSNNDFVLATVDDTSQLTVSTGGEVRGSTNQADFTGVIASGNSTVSVMGGEISGVTSNGDATGVIARDNSLVLLSGGRISSVGFSGVGTAVLLEQNARLEMTGGELASANDLVANDDSTALLSGGSIAFSSIVANDRAVIEVESPTDFAFGRFTTNDDAHISIFGLTNSFGQYIANGNSSISILGGDASGSEIFSNDQATVFLFGSEFDRPFGAVTDTTGIISGILSDGTSFSYDFQRQSTASIILAVPEPSSSLLLGLVSIGLFLTRSRKRQK